MMIETRWLQPTTHLGSRIVARCGEDRFTLARDYRLNLRDDHERVAGLVADRFGESVVHSFTDPTIPDRMLHSCIA
jgi:hypothetical protein